jgi:hypothetical protein
VSASENKTSTEILFKKVCNAQKFTIFESINCKRAILLQLNGQNVSLLSTTFRQILEITTSKTEDLLPANYKTKMTEERV